MKNVSFKDMIKLKVGGKDTFSSKKGKTLLLNLLDDDIAKILMSNINETFFATLNKLPVTETNSFVKQKRLLEDYANKLSDVQKAKFYEVFFRRFYRHVKPDTIFWNNVFE